MTGVDAFALVQWVPEMLVLRTATPAPAAGGDAAKPEGEAATAAATTEEKTERRYVRGLKYPRGETRPMLVYFHWPHDDGARGKEIVRYCSGPLEDGEFGRISWLFHCVEVNTRDSTARLVEEAGIKSTPTIAVCRADGEIVWKTEDRGMSGGSLASALAAVLKKDFPDDWAATEREQERQKEALKEADGLLRKGSLDDGIGVLRGIVESNVRIGKSWESAVKALQVAEAKQKREQEQAKK